MALQTEGEKAKFPVVQGSQKNSVQAWGPSNRQPVSTWTHQSKNVWKAKEIDQKIPKEKIPQSCRLWEESPSGEDLKINWATKEKPKRRDEWR